MSEGLDHNVFYHDDTHDKRPANEPQRFATMPWINDNEKSISVEAARLCELCTWQIARQLWQR